MTTEEIIEATKQCVKRVLSGEESDQATSFLEEKGCTRSVLFDGGYIGYLV